MMNCFNEYICVRSLLSGIRLCVCACVRKKVQQKAYTYEVFNKK